MSNSKQRPNVVVIGSGFAGISAAAYLARSGAKVTVLEKNEGPGGRASVLKEDGFQFDMGPSWYWMPDVFEKWFADFGSTPAEHYDLQRVDPSYRVWFAKDDFIDVPAKLSELYDLFESLEPGSGPNLKKFLDAAGYKYEVGIGELVHLPSRTVTEFIDFRLLKGLMKMKLFQSYEKHVDALFKNERIKRILEFPVYFLGGTPANTPSLYSLMSYADLALGTWYPMGGVHEVIKGMVRVAESMGVEFRYNEAVTSIEVTGKDARILHTVNGGENGRIEADIVVGGADYHHIEQHLLKPEHRQYSESYWDSRVMAPSSLIFYLGVDRRTPELLHHNLFFDADFDEFAEEIYDNPTWPRRPLFYVNVPSATDPICAPEGQEAVFILVPVAPGLENNKEEHDRLYDEVLQRLEEQTGTSIRDHVIYRKDFAHKEFIDRYNAFKGNAYGLANTLMQTAILKPGLKSPKVKNLYYTGQLTVPGPGVPPSLISGSVVAGEIVKDYSRDFEWKKQPLRQTVVV